MKNLRQLIRRYRNKSSDQSQRAPRRRHDSTQRRLTTEALERRELLAAGVLEMHNPWNQFDVNNDRNISARDALGVINYLGRGESEQGVDDGDRMFYDVNGDNEITAADALGVINAIGRGEGMTEPLVELLVSVREYKADAGEAPFDDDLLPNADGVYDVEVGDVIDVEIAYEDLRGFGARLGVFQLIADMNISQSGVLAPLLFETQRVVIDQSIENVAFADRPNTSITLSIPNSPPGLAGNPLSHVSTWTAFSQSPQTEVRAALNAFGYTNDQFFLSTPSGIGDDTGIEIHWTDLAFANIDLPNVTVEVNEAPGAANIPTDSSSIAPDSTDPDSIATNLNVFSRTFKDNDPFYDSNNAGTYNPATGFSGLKGIGGIPTAGGGIPQLAGNDGYPAGDFDAFSLLFEVVDQGTGVEVSVVPTPGEAEAVLVYGLDDPVDPDPATDAVIVEGRSDVDVLGNGRATIILNITDPNASNPPVAADGAMPAFNEGSSGSVDLSGFLSGGAANTVISPSTTLPGTVNIGAGPNFTLTYTPVNDDENTNGTITYTATNDDGSDSGTISVTINPINDAPVAVDDNGPFQAVSGTPITLTDAQLTSNDDPGAADETGDTLTAVPEGVSSANGGSISAVVGGIQYTPPGGGFTGNDTFTYRVNDGSVNSANTATVTVNVTAEPVDPPTAADGSIPAFDEGSTGSLNLSGLLGGGTPASVVVSDQGSLGTASIGSGPNFTLTYTPSDINNFGADSIEYTASNAGGSSTGTISITINPVNDAPVADNETLSTPENTPLTIQFSTLLSGDTVGPANEIPLDTLSIQLVNDPLNPLASLDQNGSLTYNPPPDFFGSDSFTYVITDGSPDGALTDTGTVTITITEGPNNLPEVDAPLSQSFSEDDAPTTITEAALLFGARDDDDDDLSVRNLQRTSGDAAGISIVGNTLSVTPGANGSLTDGASASAVFTYEVFDGQAAVDQTITVTINGENDPPSTGPVDDILTFTGSDPVIIDVLAEADAGSGENQSLSIVSASLSNPAAGTVTFDNAIRYTQAAAFEGDFTILYAISDGEAQDTGSVEVSVVDFVPSLIDGYVFIDRMENARDVVLDGATPFRDGEKDSNEQGLGGIPIQLVSDEMTWTAVTDLDGKYEFVNVAPGSYTLMYEPISDVVHGPVVPMSIDIGPAGGETVEVNVPLLGLTAQATRAHDILARTYLNGAITVAALSNGGQEGLFVSLGSDGAPNFVMAGEGFDDVKYADVRTIEDSDTDAALLTLLKENGDVVSAIVPHENASIGPDGSFVRLFGGINEFSFVTYDDEVSEFEDFRAAIDEILGDLE